MKTTLIIGTNRLTADLTCDEIIDIFSTFYGRMEASLELPPQ